MAGQWMSWMFGWGKDLVELVFWLVKEVVKL